MWNKTPIFSVAQNQSKTVCKTWNRNFITAPCKRADHRLKIAWRKGQADKEWGTRRKSITVTCERALLAAASLRGRLRGNKGSESEANTRKVRTWNQT